MASIHIWKPKSLEKSGTNKYLRPTTAPSRKNARINKIRKKKYGTRAVNTIILPEVFTPFLITR